MGADFCQRSFLCHITRVENCRTAEIHTYIVKISCFVWALSCRYGLYAYKNHTLYPKWCKVYGFILMKKTIRSHFDSINNTFSAVLYKMYGFSEFDIFRHTDKKNLPYCPLYSESRNDVLNWYCTHFDSLD